MIKTIVFDLGGVVMTIDSNQAVKHFKEIGVVEAEHLLDPYTQSGIFGDVEEGNISAEEFREALSEICGKELTYDDCVYAWTGYVKDVPVRNLQYLEKLRSNGHRMILLSNTNPFMQNWAQSARFSILGKPLNEYFDAMYLSYEQHTMKPGKEIFQKMLSAEHIFPEETLFVDDGQRNIDTAKSLGFQTYKPINGEDWTRSLQDILA